MNIKTYDGVGGGFGRNGLDAHAFQVVDKPCQIFALQVQDCTSIPFTAKEAAEALVELRRRSVETVELF